MGVMGIMGVMEVMRGLRFHDNLDLHDAAIVHFHDLEGEMLVGYLLVQVGEIALDLEQQACQGVGIALNGVEELVIQLQDLGEVGEQGLALEEVGVLIQAGEGQFLVIILVVYLTYNLLNDVFHRHDAARSAELVHDDGNVHLVCLEIAQQVVNHLGFRYEVRRADKTLPTEIGRLAQVRQEVLDVEHALDVVLRTLIDWYAAIVVLDDRAEHLGIRRTDIETYDVHAARHNLARRLSPEADNTLQHTALLGNILLVGQFHCLLQIVNSQALRL